MIFNIDTRSKLQTRIKLKQDCKVSNRVYFLKRDNYRDYDKVVRVFCSAYEHIRKADKCDGLVEAFRGILSRLVAMSDLKLSKYDINNDSVLAYCDKLDEVVANLGKHPIDDAPLFTFADLDDSAFEYSGEEIKYVTVTITEEFKTEHDSYVCLLIDESDNNDASLLATCTELLTQLGNFTSDYIDSAYPFKFTESGLFFDIVSAVKLLFNEFVYLLNCSSYRSNTYEWYDDNHLADVLSLFDAILTRTPIHLRALVERNTKEGEN